MQPIHATRSRPHAPVDPPRRRQPGAGDWPSRIGIGGLLATLVLSLDAHAIGLGRAQVWSALGDPLRAEVELSGLGAEEAATLRVEIAPPQAYQDAWLEYHPLLGDLRVALERRADGSARVRLDGSRAASVPYLHLLLRISSNSGQVTRGYTLLLDPNARPAPPQARQDAVTGTARRQQARPVDEAPARAPPADAWPPVGASPAPPPAIRPTPASAPRADTALAPATVGAADRPATTPASTPKPPPAPTGATAAAVSRPDGPAITPTTPGSHGPDGWPRPRLTTALVAVSLALIGLLAWARQRQRARRAAASITAVATPVEPVPGAASFGTVLAATLAGTAASPPHHASGTPAEAGGLDIDLAALEQAASTTPPEQNPATAGQSGEVPLDFHPTPAAEPERPDSGQAGTRLGDDPMAGQPARPGSSVR